MATWATHANTRNYVINDGTATNRPRWFLTWFDDAIDLYAGWTRVGCGSGTAGSFNWTGVKIFPAMGSIAGMADFCWAVYRNAAGLEILIRVTSQYIQIVWSGATGFDSAGISATSPPATPADGVAHSTSTSYTNFGATNPQKISMAYTTDHNSFVVYGKRVLTDDIGLAVLTLEEYKVGDTHPFLVFQDMRSGASVWTSALRSQNPSLNTSLGYHPTTGVIEYTFSETIGSGNDIWASIPVDPVSGLHQKMELLCICGTAGSYHIRGKIPGIYEVSAALATGDRLDDGGGGVYNLVVIGNYAVPWCSSDAFSW